jgi:hypothetical protein
LFRKDYDLKFKKFKDYWPKYLFLRPGVAKVISIFFFKKKITKN